MSRHHFKIKTLGLLLKLLSNHYSHQYPCFHCKCRCHQQKTIQIDTILKYKRISRQMSGPGHRTETLEKNVRKETSKSNTNEQRESWNQNGPRLIERRTLEY